MSLQKLQKQLCSDEAEAAAVARHRNKPSFIKAASVLGEEAMLPAKLSELPLKRSSRFKLLSLLDGMFVGRGLSTHVHDPSKTPQRWV